MTAPCLPEQKTQLENKDRQIANLKAKMGGVWSRQVGFRAGHIKQGS